VIKRKEGLRTRQVSGQETIASSEANRISEDSAGDSKSRAQAGTNARRLGLLSLHTDIQFEVVNMAIEPLSHFL